MSSKRLRDPITLSAALEGATGAALVLAPSMVARLLLGQELAGAGVAMARLCGLALVSLGIACMARVDSRQPARALLVYNICTALYIGWLRFFGATSGPLLLPALVAHVVFAFLLARRRRT